MVRTNVSEKWEQVYQIIPYDGSIIRFKEITKKLPSFSRSTISAALTYFCYNGLINKEVKSKKNVLYSRTKKTNMPPEAMDNLWTDLNNKYDLDDTEKLFMQVDDTRFPYHRDLLLQLKAEGKDDDLKLAQAMTLNKVLSSIELSLMSALQDYVKEPDKEKAQIDFNNEIKLHYVPTLKELTRLVEGIGLDNVALRMLANRLSSRGRIDQWIKSKEYLKK